MTPDQKRNHLLQLVIEILASAVVFAAIVWLIVGVAAASECLTKEQARAKWPTQHLWWHTKDRCWDDQPGRVHYQPRKKLRDSLKLSPPPRDANGNIAHHSGAPVDGGFNEIDAQADKRSVIYPALMPGQAAEPWMIVPVAMTAWPMLIDIDLSPNFDPWQNRIAGAFQK